jgi:hypothetical protein
MGRAIWAAMAAFVLSLSASCSSPTAKGCSGNTDCPSNATCVRGVCQAHFGSQGAQSLVSGAGRMSGGTVTMDVVIGAPVAPKAGAGNVQVKPAEVTR